MRLREWRLKVLNPKTKEWERVATSSSRVLIYEELKDYAERVIGTETVTPKRKYFGELKEEYSIFKNDAFITHAEIEYDYIAIENEE